MISPVECVLDFLTKIPEGRVVRYKDVALACGLNNPRHVGRILHHNPDAGKYPCHRVVRSDGKLASGYAFGGVEEHRMRLLAEGVMFKKNGRVDLENCLWLCKFWR